MKIKSRGLAIGAVAAVLMLAAGTAVATSVSFSGGAMTQRQVRTQTSGSEFTSNAFVDVPSSPVVVTVPNGQSRLVTARFTTEVRCLGPASQLCAARIVARNSALGTIEMHPQVGLDYGLAPSSSSRVLFHSGSAARTLRLPAGTWTIVAQGAVTGTGVTARFDDWTFEVDVNS